MPTKKEKLPFEKPELSVEELSIALYNSNQRLSEVNRQLKESERSRLEMLSNLSHDLRSPVATIRSYIEYLLSFDTIDENETRSILALINNKVLLLDHLMNELLTITTLDAATEDSFNFEPVQIGMFLEEFFYSCMADKKYEERALIMKVPSEFPYISSIDTNMFNRVLDNLFNNALKYSSTGDSIILDAYHKEEEVIISVSDTGIGIEASNLTKIFDRTFMVSNARTPGISKGCGLGLSIVQSIVIKHNGRIWCESQLNEGSTFYIALPCKTK